MNDEEFQKLQELYYKEVEKRNSIERVRQKMTDIQDAIDSLEYAKNSSYENVGKIHFEISGTSDGHEWHNLKTVDLKISNNIAIAMFKSELSNLAKEVETLSKELESE